MGDQNHPAVELGSALSLAVTNEIVDLRDALPTEHDRSLFWAAFMGGVVGVMTADIGPLLGEHICNMMPGMPTEHVERHAEERRAAFHVVPGSGEGDEHA